MIYVDPDFKELILQNTVSRSLIIYLYNEDDTPFAAKPTITDSEIVSESMEIQKSIMDGEELKFGGCIASQFRIQVFDIAPELEGLKIRVDLVQSAVGVLYPADDLYPSDDLYPDSGTESATFMIFLGRIDTAKRLENRHIKEIVAFDDFYRTRAKIREYLANHNGVATIRQLRNLIEYYHGIRSDVATSFINDASGLDFTVANIRSVLSEDTTDMEMLRDYCELNARFGYMGIKQINNGTAELRYLSLDNTAPAEVVRRYKSLTWEDYTTAYIGSVSLSCCVNQTILSGSTQMSGTSRYSSGNFITKCCDTRATAGAIVRNLKDEIVKSKYRYRPFDAVLFDYWWLEPGDLIRIYTGSQIPGDIADFTSFVFSVTISGIHNMTTAISTKGTKIFGREDVS